MWNRSIQTAGMACCGVLLRNGGFKLAGDWKRVIYGTVTVTCIFVNKLRKQNGILPEQLKNRRVVNLSL